MLTRRPTNPAPDNRAGEKTDPLNAFADALGKLSTAVFAEVFASGVADVFVCVFIDPPKTIC
ncbi:hypothetical protein HMPREF3192_00389 [Atopobium deltae]|uniref:Uncharacterized protein n=1 Tax=Atopobium deltae TaxID=1393034 RepID=A0A133XWJ4_9ACTN|nr:hypothetical protein HMPREF3192_00389 [Atopobium deltae]